MDNAMTNNAMTNNALDLPSGALNVAKVTTGEHDLVTPCEGWDGDDPAMTTQPVAS